MFCNNTDCDCEGVKFDATYVYCPFCGEELNEEKEDETDA